MLQVFRPILAPLRPVLRLAPNSSGVWPNIWLTHRHIWKSKTQPWISFTLRRKPGPLRRAGNQGRRMHNMINPSGHAAAQPHRPCAETLGIHLFHEEKSNGPNFA